MNGLPSGLVPPPRSRTCRPRIYWIALSMLAIAGLAAFVLVGLQDRPVAGGVYREAVIGQPLSFNPLDAATDPLSNDLARLMQAGLVRVVDAGPPTPDLAASWQISDDAHTYTFQLKPGTVWHDGQALTSADVAATVAFVQSTAFSGPAELAAVWRRVHVETPDSRTVRFSLDEPYAPRSE